MKDGESLFDYLRRQAIDELSIDSFDTDGNVFVRVLKVFEIPVPRRGTSWVDAVTPEIRLGKKKTVMAFKGRVFTNNYEKYLTIHSSIPEPDEYQNHIHSEQFIDLHPTFLVIKNTGAQKLEVGDICRCTFPSRYPEAGGDSYGFYVDRITNVESTGLKMRREQMAKESFKPKNRIFDPPPAPTSFFDKLPLNIVLVGDNMFGSSPTRLGVDSSFASSLKSRMKSLYRELDRVAAKQRSPARLAKKFGLDKDLVTKIADKMRSENLRIPYKNLHIQNLAVGNVDATYYDPEQTSNLYSGKQGAIEFQELEKTVQSGAEILDGAKNLKRPDLKNELAPPKFFIAGFEGNSSAIPGWAGLLPDAYNGDAIASIAHSAWGGDDPLKAEKKEYTQLQKYAEYIAGEDEFKFIDIKQTQFEAMLNHLKNSGMEAGVLVGPLVLTSTGKSYPPDPFKETSASIEYPGSYTLSAKPSKSKRAKTIREAIFHPGFYYRSGMSEAMRVAAENASLDVWTCIPYCARNSTGTSGHDKFSEQDEKGIGLIPKPIPSSSSRNTRKREQKVLSSWIMNNILAYALGEPPGFQTPACTSNFDNYGEYNPLNYDPSRVSGFDEYDIAAVARLDRTLRIQKELVKELDRIYSAVLKEGQSADAAATAEMLQYTNTKVKNINSYLKAGVLDYTSLPSK